MKKLMVFVCVVVTASAYGDSTADLLHAKHVDNYIRIKHTAGGELKRAVDSRDPAALKTLQEGETFRSDGEISIDLADFNPLKEAYTVSQKATPDVNYGAIKAFLDDLQTLQKALPSPKGGGSKPEDLAGCERLKRRIELIQVALIDEELKPEAFEATINRATGHKGVTDAEGDIRVARNRVDANVKAIREQLNAIVKEFGAEPEKKPKHTCDQINSMVLINYTGINSTAVTVLAQKEALSRQLTAILDSLKPFLDRDVWSGQDRSDYPMASVTPTFSEHKSVTLSSKKKAVSVSSDKKSIVIAGVDKSEKTANFIVRRDSTIVPERAAALIYNDLKYPRFAAEPATGGRVVIREAGFDRHPVDGAVMLNLIARRGISVVHPMLQLGVSSAKDFPGIIAGVGLRFTEPVAFSLSVGGMMTRFKDIDDRSLINTDVAAEEFEKHMKLKNSPVALYGAFQFKF